MGEGNCPHRTTTPQISPIGSHSVYCATGVASSTKWQHLQLVDGWFLTLLHISPQETRHGIFSWQKADLMEHAFYVTADGDSMLAESRHRGVMALM